MKMNYVAKIRAKVSISANKKTSNLFDGSYKSVYQGNGLDFENLREYNPGDSIRDIDWKATSRSGKVLVKRYVAEKKHNIMIVFDTGKSMAAHTDCNQVKKEIALNVGGVIGYLAAQNGDNVGAIYNRNGKIQFYPFRTGVENIEKILTEYDREVFDDYETDIEKTLEYIVKNIKRNMILFVVTDPMGIANMSQNTLKKLVHQHNVLFISINDAKLTEGKAFDVDRNSYIPEFISGNKKLLRMEQEIRQKLYADNEKKLLQNRIISTCIDKEEEIVDKIIELLEGHKYANQR